MYSPHMFVALTNRFGYSCSLRAKDIYVVDSCENIPGRTHTILFCTNIVTGEKTEFSKNVIDSVLPNLVKRLLEEEIENTKKTFVLLKKNLSDFSFQED